MGFAGKTVEDGRPLILQVQNLIDYERIFLE
jgi:hypothetical protein